MVVEFLNKIRSQILEQKLELESMQNSIGIELSENNKFIEKLKSEDDQNFDAFSPRKQNRTLRETIISLEDKQQILLDKFEDIKNQLMDYNSKLDELESVLKVAKKQKIAQDKSKNNFLNEDDLLKITILEIQENERQRIAREIHDSPVQNLTSMVHKTELCSKLIDMDPIRCKLELSSMSKNIREIIEEMRRMIYNLHPMSFDDIGFDVTLERELLKIQEKGINTSYSVEGTPYLLKSVISITILRVITEACNNSLKHSEATKISVKICYEQNSIKIFIQDNGKGFDVSAQKGEIREDNSGFGLSTMKERICLLSGKLDISSEIGVGTTVKIEVPIEESEE